MACICLQNQTLILENDYVRLTLSSKDGSVKEVLDKQRNCDIRGEETQFFTLTNANEEKIAITGLTYQDDCICVACEKGSFLVRVAAYAQYFTFEIASALPKDVFKLQLAYVKYAYDYTDKSNVGAAGVALTVLVNPVYFPDCKALETQGEVFPELGDVGAKYALVFSPISSLCQTLKTVCKTIDRQKGLFSEIGGAWGRDSRLNFGNYMIQWDASASFIEENLPSFKQMGVDQIDFHQGPGSFRQGDFKFYHFKDAADFRERGAKRLEENGIAAGLHTYSIYIDYGCDTLLSNPEAQKDFSILHTFTLKDDVSATADFFPTQEPTDDLNPDQGFMVRNTPYMLIDEEIVRFEIAQDGVKIVERGAAGTKAVTHKKGAVLKHLDGYYHGVAPVLGSKLFLDIARGIAKTFNEGGFKMIYLDALDGIVQHCDKRFVWYYAARFVLEILKHCNRYPLIEFSFFPPALWAARGRIGAWDTPYRGYKDWNKLHAAQNKEFIDRFSAATMGWYNFFPVTDKYPGNEHTKYEYPDDIEHLGSLSVMYDFSMVYFMLLGNMQQYAGTRRNIAIYRKYDDLRKAQYFPEEYLQKLRDGKWEYHLVKKRGKWLFVEKDYQKKKLYDLADDKRNQAVFDNPFGKQTPFIRIESMLSTAGQNPVTLLDLDEKKDLSEQILQNNFSQPLNLVNNLAKKIRVKGNGVKGGKIAIRFTCATNSEPGSSLYIIDTDFRGWREFILLEADCGARNDHSFEKGTSHYTVYRSGFNNDRVTGIEILTEGDVTGVKASSVTACQQVYDVLKNPTVEIGESKVTFECELKSSDYIEFDGKTAKVVDRYGNEMPIWFTSNLVAKRGKFKAKLTAKSLNGVTPRAQLTVGFTGKVIR